MQLINTGNNLKSHGKDDSLRDITLDIAKGILILLMVIGHSGAPKWLVNCIYSFHMPCFFIISGILFSYFYLGKPLIFIKKRIKSIWWPFVKWTWIFLICHNLFYNFGFYQEPYTFSRIISKFIKIFFLLDLEQLLGGFWFLRSLLIASLICFCYYKLIGTNKVKLIAGIIILVVLAEILTIYKISFLYFKPINILACAYFMSGTLLNSFEFRKVRKKEFIITTSVILIGISSMGDKVEMANLTSLNLVPYFIKSLVISYGFILILETVKYTSWSKYLTYLGMKTMDILIIHFLAFKIISLLKIQIFGLDSQNLKNFPVIEENNSIFWIVYVILGIVICLSYSKIKDYLHNCYLLWKDRKNKTILL